MRAQCPQMGRVLTAQHHADRLALAREHLDCRFTIGECCVACNNFQLDQFSSGSLMVWRGISLEYSPPCTNEVP